MPHPKEAVEKLMQQAAEAKKAGRMDEAKRLHVEAGRIRKELKKGEIEGNGERRPEAERLDHMMRAVGELHAAGMHEPAEAIERAAQDLRRELEEQMKRRHAEEAERREDHAGEKRLHAELDEMRRQMRKMAEQIEQLQAELKKRGS